MDLMLNDMRGMSMESTGARPKQRLVDRKAESWTKDFLTTSSSKSKEWTDEYLVNNPELSRNLAIAAVNPGQESKWADEYLSEIPELELKKQEEDLKDVANQILGENKNGEKKALLPAA